MYPTDIKYHPEHTWVKLSGTTATIGISYFAQQSLGTVTFIDLPDVGAKVAADAVIGTIESVKAINDLFSPVTGT